MTNIVKKTWQHTVLLCFMLFTLAPLSSHAHGTPVHPLTALSCDPPSVSKTGQSAGYVSFAWSPVDGATGYQVWYVNKGNNNSSWVYSTGNTSIEFFNLPSGTYDFYFKTVCGGDASYIVILNDLIL